MSAHRAPELTRAVRVYPKKSQAPFGDYELVDFKDEFQLVQVIARHAVQQRNCQAIIGFGYPGNGKRAFAQKLANHLHADHFDVMWLDVEVLCSRRRDVLAIEVEEVRATLGKRSMRPLLVVADRLDALPLALPRNEDLAGLLTSLRDMASASPPLVLFATAVSPAVVGPIIPQLEPTYVYFDWPTGERAEEFLHLAGWPRWIQFAQKIAGLAEKRKVHLTTGSLVNGLGELKRIVKDPESPFGNERRGVREVGVGSFARRPL